MLSGGDNRTSLAAKFWIFCYQPDTLAHCWILYIRIQQCASVSGWHKPNQTATLVKPYRIVKTVQMANHALLRNRTALGTKEFPFLLVVCHQQISPSSCSLGYCGSHLYTDVEEGRKDISPEEGREDPVQVTARAEDMFANIRWHLFVKKNDSPQNEVMLKTKSLSLSLSLSLSPPPPPPPPPGRHTQLLRLISSPATNRGDGQCMPWPLTYIVTRDKICCNKRRSQQRGFEHETAEVCM